MDKKIYVDHAGLSFYHNALISELDALASYDKDNKEHETSPIPGHSLEGIRTRIEQIEALIGEEGVVDGAIDKFWEIVHFLDSVENGGGAGALKTFIEYVGALSNLNTTNKENLVNAINEVNNNIPLIKEGDGITINTTQYKNELQKTVNVKLDNNSGLGFTDPGNGGSKKLKISRAGSLVVGTNSSDTEHFNNLYIQTGEGIMDDEQHLQIRLGSKSGLDFNDSGNGQFGIIVKTKTQGAETADSGCLYVKDNGVLTVNPGTGLKEKDGLLDFKMGIGLMENSGNGNIQVKSLTNGAISVSSSGVGVNVANPLLIENDSIGVKCSNGMWLDANGLIVDITDYNGNTNGLQYVLGGKSSANKAIGVKTGNGLEIYSDGSVQLKVKLDNILRIDDEGYLTSTISRAITSDEIMNIIYSS